MCGTNAKERGEKLIEMFFILIAIHLVADYVLQGDSVATGKNKNLDPAKFGVSWYYWLSAHAATHSLLVGIAVQNFYAGLIEFVWHFITDYLKCEKKINLHMDQVSHVVCKLIIVIVFKGWLS